MTESKKINKNITMKSNASDQASVFHKLLEDKNYRKKFIRTLCILFSYTTLGFFYGNLGPALPDIQLLTGQSLDVMAWLFTATYAGSLIGTLICGPLCDRVGPQLVLFVSVFMASCLTGVFIFSPNFTTMIIVRGFTGVFIGGVDIGGIASIADLWQSEARPFMHALQCMISIGGIVSPFIIEPFLAKRQAFLDKRNNNSSSLDLNITNLQTSNFSGILTRSGILTATRKFTTIKSADLNIPQTETANLSVEPSRINMTVDYSSSEGVVIGGTLVQYAFIIFAIAGVIASVSVFLFVISDCRNKHYINKVSARKKTAVMNRTRNKLTDNLKYLLLGIIAVQSYLSAALGLKVYALLPSFFVIQFGWSTSQASVATSGFWIGKAASRFAGIFVSTKMRQAHMISLFSLIYVISSVCLTIAASYRINTLAWVVTVTMGIGLSLLRSSLFTMTEEKITHVSGKVASLYLVFFVVGGMTDPLYTGYLMDNISSLWFTYLLVFESAMFLALFLLIKVILKFVSRKETGFKIEIKPMNDTDC